MDMVVWLANETPVDPSLTGGKAANLLKLAAVGMPVPQAFCLTTLAYDSFVARNGLLDAISALSPLLGSSGLARLDKASADIFAAFQKATLPPAVETALAKSYRELRQPSGKSLVPVAVRSSATAEDLAEASFAGQHDTFLNVQSFADLVESVKGCWASLWSARAIHYRSIRGIGHSSARMAVVVQRMVDAEVSAVTFTIDPVSGRHDRLLINLSWGLGEAIVSGLVTPDSYLLSKEPLTIEEASIGEKAQMAVFAEGGGTKEVEVPEPQREVACVSDGLVLANASLCLEIEKQFGYPVDVESALSKGQWYILQARPVTTQ